MHCPPSKDNVTNNTNTDPPITAHVSSVTVTYQLMHTVEGPKHAKETVQPPAEGKRRESEKGVLRILVKAMLDAPACRCSTTLVSIKDRFTEVHWAPLSHSWVNIQELVCISTISGDCCGHKIFDHNNNACTCPGPLIQEPISPSSIGTATQLV